jgi:O-antigen biosynthesis protein
MNPSKSSAPDPAGWPVVPQTTNGELSHRTDSHQFSDSPRGCIVCVLGMHRSGTSVAARLMNLLGVDLGAEEQLLSSQPDNPKGYWEYQPILDLNEEILERLGGNWHEPPPLQPGWETAAELADLRRRARDLVAQTFASGDWGWKDPRTCLTLPFWKQILPPIHYVICMRSPAEVSASLEKRHGFSVEKSTRLWHIYTGAALEHTAGFPRHFIFYEDVVRSHREEVSRLARFLDRLDALDQPGVRAAIEDFFEPEFHHQRTSLINTLDDPNILFPAKAFYFAVRIAARSGGPCQGLSDIPGRDAVGEQIWPAFSRSSRRAQEDRDEMTRVRSGLESRLGEIAAEAQELRIRLSDMEIQKAAKEAAHTAIQDRSRELEADNRRLAEERDRASTLASELRAGLDEREAVCQEQARGIAGRDAEIAGRDAEIAALAERAALVQRLEEDREARQAEMESIRARLGELEADNRRLGEEWDRAQAQARELRAGLDEREAVCQEQARVIAGRDAEIAALAERAALVQRLEEDREARQAEIEAIRAGLGELKMDNRRLGEERDRAEVLARELRAGLDERDTVVASLGSRLTEWLAAREVASDWTRDVNEMGGRLEVRIAELTGQIGGLAAGFAQMGSLEVGREAAMLQIRDLVSGRQDEIQAMVSHLSGTVDYLGMIRRVRADMRRLVPPASRVIVISKGDPDLLDVEGQDVRHFPQDDRGDYAGHYPAESGEAIAHLEALRDRGARFLVIPSSASWWLEHYGDLARHLDASYQRIWKSADCQIYELAGPDRSRRPEPGPRQTTEARPMLQAVDVAAVTPAPPALEPGCILATCDMPGPDPLSIGPGHLRVRGWALSKAGIEDVRVFIDGLPREGLTYGAVRFDVAAVHPEFPNANHSGFIGKIDLEGLAEGEHSLVVRVRSRDGREMELIRSFQLDPHARPDRWDLNAEYPVWLTRRTPSVSDLARMRIAGGNLLYRPVISLVVPVYNTPEKYLSLMVDSVMAQTYDQWELCLADDASNVPHVRPFLDRLARGDARVKVTHLPRNQGISAASNAALALATGEFIGLLDHDDVLAPSALFEVVRTLNDAPATDLIYSDEDKVDDTGRERWDPFFKPDWSPDLLLTTNYVCHFGVYRRSLVEAIGGFRPAYDGSQDYDLVLRFTERTDRIVHVPSVLYSWRAIPGSAARNIVAKPYVLDPARRAIDDALRRRGVAGRVEPGQSLGQWRVRYDVRGQPAVTVVIPAGGNMKCLPRCLESVLERSTYSNLHVLVTDDSDGTAVADLCRALGSRDPRLRYRRFRLEPFNYSAINNAAVSLVDTPYVVLLNDDVTVITPDWVEAMLEHAQRPEIGVVGAKLLYPDRSLQHGGVILGPCQNCGHAFKHLSENDPGYFGLDRAIRNCSAVTFACAMMRRTVFDEVGGLDAQNLTVAFNDVDICLRIRERGYWVVYTPYAVLFHHESATRTMHSNPGEVEYMRRRWAGVIRHDPFYNPNLTREAEDYSLNFDAPTIVERLGPIEDGPLTKRHGPDHGLEAGFSPTLGLKGEVHQDQASDRPPTRIDLVTKTIDLGRHIQVMVGRWRDRFSELSTRLERQSSRLAPERDPPVANRDRPGRDAPGAQHREGAGGEESVERRAVGNGKHVAKGPPSTVAPPAVAAPEGVNGYRPKRNSYPQVRRRIREVVSAELPTGSVVVVVSRGDDNLLQLGPRRGWHFPQTEAGVYAGFYPADSEEAIAHLEEIRRMGADYLLFPSTAFWWLGFYGDFQKHLESHYPCVCSDPSCLIFQLSTNPGSYDRRR